MISCKKNIIKTLENVFQKIRYSNLNLGFWFIGLCALFSFHDLSAQLDSIHYIPPVHNRNWNSTTNGDRYQAVYLSTPSISPITVTIENGLGTILKSFSVSNTTEAIFDLNDFYGNNNGVYENPGDDNNLSNNNTVLSVSRDSLNRPLFKSGLILKSTGLFYANFRIKTGSQACSLTAKGQAAQGTEFYIGANPNNTEASRNRTNIFTSFMAIEDNTTIIIDGHPDTTIFHDPTLNFSAYPLTFTLNAGESYVISTYTDENIANTTENGLIGARVRASNPIVMNNGNLLHGALDVNGAARDMGMDQSVPIEWLGTQYAFIRGNQTDDDLEIPMIIAISDNTDVSVNGTYLATLSRGEYLRINGSYYSADETMYVQTSKRSYAYQQLFGSTTRYSSGLNFIPPLGCFLPTDTEFLPQVDQLHPVVDHDISTTITVITYQGSDVRVYDATTNALLQTLTAVSDAVSIPGTSEWIAYTVPGQQDNIRVSSDGPLATGIFGFSGANGIAGYYTGFGGKAALRRRNLAAQIGGTCAPIYSLSEIPIEADEVQWVRNIDARVISRDTIIDVLQNGDYTVLALNGTCVDSIPFTVECVQISCADYDGDGVNDIADLDSDDDGILDTIECPLQYPILNPSFINDDDWTYDGAWDVGGGRAATNSGNIANQVMTQTISGLADACSHFIKLNLSIATSGYLDNISSVDTAEIELSFDGHLIAKILNPSGDTYAYVSELGDSVKVDASVLPISSLSALTYYPMSFYIDWTNLPASGEFVISFTGERDVFYIDEVEFEYYNCGPEVDRDNDGIPNCLDLDSDNDGIPDEVEGCGRLFTGPVSYQFTASGCSSGLIDGKWCAPLDSDGDGVFNFIDLDSDNDGIWDGVEAGHNDSIDVNGRIYTSSLNSGNNGLFDALETTPDNDTISYLISNSESTPDNIFDAYEIDSDGDSCYDTIEAELNDPEEDGIIGSGIPSVDLDGLVLSHGYSDSFLSDRWQNPDVNHCILCRTAVLNPHVLFYRKRN